jgi:hypothetical protein
VLVSSWRRGGRGGLGSSLGRGGSSSFTSTMVTEQVILKRCRSRGCYCLAVRGQRISWSLSFGSTEVRYFDQDILVDHCFDYCICDAEACTKLKYLNPVL